MKSARWFFIGILLVAVVGCGSSSSNGSNSSNGGSSGKFNGTIKIGAFAPETGAYAQAGIDIIDAVKIAVREANAKGGVMGKKVVLSVQDSPCNAQVAVQAAQKLVTAGVIGVIGPYCSSDAIPASVIYHRANVPMITPASTNPQLTDQGFNNIFRTITRDDEQGRFVAPIMANQLHAKRIAIIHDNSTYAKGVAVETRDALQKFPSAKVVYFDAIVPNSRDYSAVLTQAKAKKIDLLYFTGYFSDGGIMIKQFYQLGVPGLWWGADANNEPNFISLAGKYADKALIDTTPSPDLIPAAKGFVKTYKADFHAVPGAYSTYAYDATNVMMYAIQKYKATTPSALVTALHKIKDYPGITGKVGFNAKGDRLHWYYILETVRNGKFVRANLQNGKVVVAK